MNNESCKKSCAVCGNKSFCFEQLSEIELELFDHKRVELYYRKGEVIAKQGAFVTHILFLQKGLTKIYKELNNSDNLILNLFPQGSLIGLPALYGSNIMQYSVAAVEDSVICAIDKQTFEQMIQENGKFAAAVINSINKCTLFNFDRVVSITQKQMNGRIAEVLLFLADSIYKSDSFHLSLTRKDLSEFTGMSLMSVVRGMKDFKESGLISEENGNIVLLNRKHLEKISISG